MGIYVNSCSMSFSTPFSGFELLFGNIGYTSFSSQRLKHVNWWRHKSRHT